MQEKSPVQEKTIITREGPLREIKNHHKRNTLQEEAKQKNIGQQKTQTSLQQNSETKNKHFSWNNVRHDHMTMYDDKTRQCQ